MHDIVITNAHIVDGTGGPAVDGDIAISNGRITHVGTAESPRVEGQASRTIDADGRLVTPGWVDIHTHFDGQVCWDKQLTPSSGHGVTTVVMGNCGVGFAPVHKGSENELVELMESVEDIPGTALHAGIPWGWQSFGEYLDAIDTPYSVDVGAQVPHVAIRHYVMGDRCYDDASPDDMAAMAKITAEALRAGAMGFTTSRFFGHRDKRGELVPGTRASAEEMLAIAGAIADVGHGAIEFVSDLLNDPDELAWIERVALITGTPILPLITPGVEGPWELANKLAPLGGRIRPQVGARPASLLMQLDGTLNPMRQFPAYRRIADLPLEEQRRQLRDPEFRAEVLADESTSSRSPEASMLLSSWKRMYVLPADLSYEPTFSDSLAGIAAAQGIDVREALMDAMANGRPILFLFGNYPGDLSAQIESIERPHSLFGLSDAGAHCGVLCDASVPTYMLAYMTRDRKRGRTMDLEFVVHKMTQDTAQTYGLHDRGVLAAGMRADINIIDYEALALHDPKMVYDLPAGGKRIVQHADGYEVTIQNGQVTYEAGVHTGAMPGRLLRAGR